MVIDDSLTALIGCDGHPTVSSSDGPTDGEHACQPQKSKGERPWAAASGKPKLRA